MCAPLPLSAHLRCNGLRKNPHSHVFSARRALSIQSRQTTILPPIPQNIPQNKAPNVEASESLASTDLPVTTPPITALSPGRSFSVPGSSANSGVQTLSVTVSVPTVDVTSPTYVTYVPSSSLAVVTLTSSFTPSSKTIVSVLGGSATVSSFTTSISTSSISSTYDTTPSLGSTTTVSSVSQSSDSTVTTTSYTSIQSTETDNPSTESFTSLTSSPVTNPSSSTVSSSTVIAPAITVSASPSPVRPANLSAHNPAFYIGIVLGTLAGIACLCALIAWFIRFRIHMRRRRAARSLKVPWANPDDGDTWGLESGHGGNSDVDIAAISAMNLGSREDLADVQAWSPRGDRDVGEPRRADSRTNESTYSLQNHPIPEYCLFSDDSVRAFTSSDGYSTASLLPHLNLRQLPSHLIDQELAARVSRERASLRSNDNIDRMNSLNRANGDCGTPRETMSKPRFLSLRGDGLNVPWKESSSQACSMAERLRNHGKRLPAEPPWEQILPCFGETDKKVEREPWTASLRSSLVSAFNAVAANLSTAAGAPRMTSDDLTLVPSKRILARKSVRDAFRDDDVLKAKELSRETSVSTMTSKAWTLEETREGAGVVHFLPSLHPCGEPEIQRPHLSGPTLSFSDGDNFVSDGYDIERQVVEHPQVPLVASEKPPPAFIRPDPSYTRRSTRKTIDSSISRAGSNYSTASMNSGAQTRHLCRQLAPPASRPGSLNIPNPYDADGSISRLSSFTTSTILDGNTGLIEEASRVLKDRLDRALEV